MIYNGHRALTPTEIAIPATCSPYLAGLSLYFEEFCCKMKSSNPRCMENYSLLDIDLFILIWDYSQREQNPHSRKKFLNFCQVKNIFKKTHTFCWNLNMRKQAKYTVREVVAAICSMLSVKPTLNHWWHVSLPFFHNNLGLRRLVPRSYQITKSWNAILNIFIQG